MLNSTLVDKFLTELSTVCVPQLYANYYLSKLIKFISDPEKLKEKFDDLKNDISQKSNTFKEFKTIEQSLKKLERKIGGTRRTMLFDAIFYVIMKFQL